MKWLCRFIGHNHYMYKIRPGICRFECKRCGIAETLNLDLPGDLDKFLNYSLKGCKK